MSEPEILHEWVSSGVPMRLLRIVDGIGAPHWGCDRVWVEIQESDEWVEMPYFPACYEFARLVGRVKELEAAK